MKKLLPLVVLFALSLSLSAQYLPNVYNQFFMNPYIYNPAYVGVEGHAVIFAMYKNQWTGIQESPSLSHVNFHIPLKGGIGFGAFAYNESIGALKSSGGKVSASYLFTLDREHFFRFGMSIGAGNTLIDQTFIDDPNDPAYQSLAGTGSFLIGDVGFTYHFGHFNLGVSLPSLFSNTLPRAEGLGPISLKPTDNALFKINYRGHISDDIAIEPHFIYRYNKYSPNQYEGTVILHVYHLVWVGGTYRQDVGAIALLGAKVKERMGIGYSIELGNSKYANQLGNTHEIHIGYHLGSKREHAEHVSSFIKSHRLSAEERAKQAELERQRKLQELRDSRVAATEQKKDDDALGILQAPVVTKVEEKPKNTWNYEREETLLERVNEFGETEKGIKFDRTNENGDKEIVFSWLPPPPDGAQTETYEIANPDEPPLERTRADGTREVGVKWVRTIDGGDKEILIVWNAIMTEAEANEIDHTPSTTMGFGAAKIVINAVPVTPPVIDVIPEEVVSEIIQKEEPAVEIETPEVVQEAIKPKPEVIAEPKEIPQVDKSLSEDTRTHQEIVESNEHLEARRGTHLLEFPVGNYVIAGAFGSYDHAESFSDTMFERGFHDTRVYYLSARGYYYVAIYQSSDLKSAVSRRNKLKSLDGLSKVWVLKVNE